MRESVRCVPARDDMLALLADELCARTQSHPQGMADIVVFLPHQRAVSRLSRLLESRGAILPQIQPLGRPDPLLVLQACLRAQVPCEIAPQANLCTFQLALAQAMQQSPQCFTQTLSSQSYWKAAGELLQALDELSTEGGCDAAWFSGAPSRLSAHWQERFRILRFAANWWQNTAQQEKVMLPGAWRHHLISQLMRAWQASPPQSPVYVVGSTGSQTSTRKLMQAVAHLPEGQVWLPASHLSDPAIAMAVEALGMTQEASTDTPEADAFALHDSQMLALPEGVQLVCAADEQEEAEIVAQLAHQALADGSQEVAIMLEPDQVRKRLIQQALRRYNIQADSALSEPLAHHPDLMLWRAMLHAATHPQDASSWLAFMKRPELAARNPSWQEVVTRTEAHMRQRSRPSAMLALLQQTADSFPVASDAHEALYRMIEAMQSFMHVLAHGSLTECFTQHRQRCEQLGGVSADAYDRTLSRFFASFAEAIHPESSSHRGRYAELFESWLAQQTYVPQAQASPVKLYSPIEARLMHADCAILCGLNEGEWPAAEALSSWLHPILRHEAGLPDRAANLALSAHDFTTLSQMAPKVYWVRAARVGGADQLPSRWLARFDVPDTPPVAPRAVRFARQAQSCPVQVTPPAPTPPPHTLVRELSVTSLELWLRDPYGFYAKQLLGLKPLDPLEVTTDAALRGEWLHAVMEDFSRTVFEGQPASAELFLSIAARHAESHDVSLMRHQWLPRLQRVAGDIAACEAQRQEGLRQLETEEWVSAEMSAAPHPVMLRARLDRLERGDDDRLAVIDYKSAPPNVKEATMGVLPQLPLSGWMAGQRFNTATTELAYWALLPSKPAEAFQSLEPAGELIGFYVAGIQQWIARFAAGELAYYAVPQLSLKPRFNDYAHLSREASWLPD